MTMDCKFFLLITLVAHHICLSNQNGTLSYTFFGGDEIKEFLNLCKGCTKCATCQESCKELLRKNGSDVYDAVKNPCNDTIVKKFIAAQTIVEKFSNKLGEPLETLILWALFIPNMLIGIFLIIVGHFDWRTLPIIGSKYHPNKTHGIPYWQYHKMKYVVQKTFLKEGEKVPEGHDSVILGSVSSITAVNSSAESELSDEVLPSDDGQTNELPKDKGKTTSSNKGKKTKKKK